MTRHVEMRYAYQELLTLSMLPLALSIIVVLTALFTLWDPIDLTHTMSALQRLGFSVFVGFLDLLICYSCGALLLYLSRFRSKFQSIAVLALCRSGCGCTLHRDHVRRVCFVSRGPHTW